MNRENEHMSDSVSTGGSGVKIGSYKMPLPRSRLLRMVIGVLLILMGLVGFLPVLGFWMIPLGLLVLSIDLPRVRRWRRRLAVWFARRYPAAAARLRVGGGNGHNGARRNGGA